MQEDFRPEWLPLVDLRGVTRDSHQMETTVDVGVQGTFHRWLRLGSLTRLDLSTNWIGALLDHGFTDKSHDSAYAFTLKVCGLTAAHCHHGVFEFKGWIMGSVDDSDAVQVPPRSWLSPLDVPVVSECTMAVCGGNHGITAYAPSNDVALWGHLRGREIRIRVRPLGPAQPQAGAPSL